MKLENIQIKSIQDVGELSFAIAETDTGIKFYIQGEWDASDSDIIQDGKYTGVQNFIVHQKSGNIFFDYYKENKYDELFPEYIVPANEYGSLKLREDLENMVADALIKYSENVDSGVAVVFEDYPYNAHQKRELFGGDETENMLLREIHSFDEFTSRTPFNPNISPFKRSFLDINSTPNGKDRRHCK